MNSYAVLDKPKRRYRYSLDVHHEFNIAASVCIAVLL